ncbi:valine--tRNA ligase-like isoform X2 [Antedon mediterranea]|uniref:valine--tRNA ligase-like isoform X2 n=1 Tax=Antedon mediterranea TaxID=105859 RepID=UPI003AF8A8B6
MQMLTWDLDAARTGLFEAGTKEKRTQPELTNIFGFTAFGYLCDLGQAGLLSRSKDIIEPLIKPQWFVNCTEMAAAAVKAVEDGDLEIISDMHIKTWNQQRLVFISTTMVGSSYPSIFCDN